MRTPLRRTIIALACVASVIAVTAYGLRRKEELDAQMAARTAARRAAAAPAPPRPDDDRFVTVKNGKFVADSILNAPPRP